jgi:hypothetical protein
VSERTRRRSARPKRPTDPRRRQEWDEAERLTAMVQAIAQGMPAEVAAASLAASERNRFALALRLTERDFAGQLAARDVPGVGGLEDRIVGASIRVAALKLADALDGGEGTG